MIASWIVLEIVVAAAVTDAKLADTVPVDPARGPVMGTGIIPCSIWKSWANRLPCWRK